MKKDPPKVFTVESGEYSDYTVHCVCSTRENAEVAAKLYGRGATVVERTLDEMPKHPSGKFHYYVRMNRAGESAECYLESAQCMPDWIWSPYGDGETVGFDVWAKDEAQAVKIANDRRRKLIALNKWTTDHGSWCPKEGKTI